MPTLDELLIQYQDARRRIPPAMDLMATIHEEIYQTHENIGRQGITRLCLRYLDEVNQAWYVQAEQTRQDILVRLRRREENLQRREVAEREQSRSRLNGVSLVQLGAGPGDIAEGIGSIIFAMQPYPWHERLLEYIQQGADVDLVSLEAGKIWLEYLKKCDTSAVIALTTFMKNRGLYLNKPIAIEEGNLAEKDYTPLMHAIKSENSEVINTLLSLETDIGINHVTGTQRPNNAVGLALDLGDKETVEKLLARTDLDLHTLDGYYLMATLDKEWNDIADKLYQLGARITSANLYHLTSMLTSAPLLLAYLNKAEKGWYLEATQLIIRIVYYDLYVDVLVQSGIPTEFIAAVALDFQDPTLMERLAQKNIRPSKVSLHKLLLKEIELEDQEAMTFLISQGANVSYNHSEALAVAVTSNQPNIDIFNVLLDGGADPKSHGYQLPLMALECYATMLDINLNYLLMAQTLLLRIGINGDEIATLFGRHDKGEMSNLQLIWNVKNMIQDSLLPLQQMPFEMIYFNRRLMQDERESSQDTSLLARADAKFAEMQAAWQHKFNRYGETPMDALTAIEREIKLCILDKMIGNARSKKDASGSALFIKFIETNKAALLNGDQRILAQFRALCKDNNDTAQVAWRVYDPFAPHDDWPNLLTQNDVTGLALRTRVAYYFIVEPAINRENFIAQLADIRRAHCDTSLDIDSPSCEKGTRGRTGKMGDGHPTLQLPPTRKEIIHQQITALITQTFSEMIKDCPPEKQLEWCRALTDLCSSTAIDIIHGQTPFEEEKLAMRIELLNRIAPQAQECINKALAEIGEAPLTDFEQTVIVQAEMLDLGGKGRANALYGRLAPECKPKPEPREETVLAIYKNPFVIVIPASANPDMRERLLVGLAKTIEKHIEFELLYPVLQAHFDQMLVETVGLMAKILCEEIATNPSCKVFAQFQERIKEMVGLSEQDLQAIYDILKEHSTIFSVDAAKLAQITAIIEKLKASTRDTKVLAKIDSVLQAKTKEQVDADKKERKIKP